MTESSAIKIENLTLSFQNTKVFESLSFSILAGQKAVITGSSGSGKSTLLKLLLGFLPFHEGAVIINKEPLSEKTIWAIRSRISYLPQEPDPGSGSVIEILERPFHYKHNASIKENLTKIPSLLERFALSQGILDQDISLLSGGEKQRVCFISSILLDRDILLLDEPWSALDRNNKTLVHDYLKNDINQFKTIVIAVHDDSSIDFADTVIPLQSQLNGHTL